MSLKNLRKKIDSIDKKIISLLSDRAQMSLSIGHEKMKSNKGIYSPDREKEVLAHIKMLNKGPMPNDALEAIYREIMSSSMMLEKTLEIAYLGPEASFSNLAALKKFGSQVQCVACSNIPEVFQKVERQDCDYGVVPIENSIEGAITHTLDLLVDSDLKICSQLIMEISLNLLSHVPLNKIKRIYANPPVFGQCRVWLLNHLPNAELIDTSSTTRAAQIVASQKDSACIASILASSVYKLPVVKRDIQDVSHNITRFLVIGRDDVPPTGHDRTSIIFSIKDRVGALHNMLIPFSQNKINLTKIESRPSKRRAWDYFFFVDFEGHRSEPRVERTLNRLEHMCKYLKILGSYPV